METPVLNFVKYPPPGDFVRKAREAHLINKAMTLRPLGRDEQN